MTTILIASFISATPARFLTARIQSDRRLCVDLCELASPGVPQVVERSVIGTPRKLRENTFPITAPWTPRYFGPRVLDIVINEDRKLFAVLVSTPDGSDSPFIPMRTIAVYKYPTLQLQKVASVRTRFFNWQGRRFLMEYLNLFGRKDRSGMSRLLKDDWSKDRRGPEAEATIHRSAAVTKGLTQKVDRAGLYPPYGLDFTYDTESFIASAELHMLAIFTSPRLHPHSKPEPIRHYVLSSKWDWRPKAMPTKHEGSRFMRFWREMLVVGTSESALEPDERPYVEAFTFSGHASFCLEAGAFLGLP